MVKSSSLVFVLIFAFLFRLEKPRWSLIFIILIISFGVLLMVANETDFVLIGYVVNHSLQAIRCIDSLK